MVSEDKILEEKEEKNNSELINNIQNVEVFKVSDVSNEYTDSDISADDKIDKDFVVSSESDEPVLDCSGDLISNQQYSVAVPLPLSEKIMVSQIQRFTKLYIHLLRRLVLINVSIHSKEESAKTKK